MKATASLLLAALGAAPAGAQTFSGLGGFWPEHHTRAHAVSADGSTVVGGTYLPGYEPRAFRWTADEGMVLLEPAEDLTVLLSAHGVSADGLVVTGAGEDHLGQWRAFRWTPATGAVALPMLDGATGESALGLSADGSVAVGISWGAEGGSQACYWTDGSVVGIGDLEGGDLRGWAFACSHDGSVIVGFGHRGWDGELMEAFRWTAEHGMTGLGAFPNDPYPPESAAFGCSGDGSIVVGWSNKGNVGRAVRWAAEDAFSELPAPPGGTQAFACSADAHVIGGQFVSDAVIWVGRRGPFVLSDLLDSLGVDEAQGWKLGQVRGTSADGRTLVGWGNNPSGGVDGWVATLPPFCPADYNLDFRHDLFDYLAFINLFNAGEPGADCDGDGALHLFDFFCFGNDFLQPC